MTNQTVNVTWHKVFQEIWDPKWRYYLYKSGRSAGKTYSICLILLLMASQRFMRIVCVREYQNSLKESVKAQFEIIIKENNWDSEFEILQERIIVKRTGSIFMFMGVNNEPETFKGIPAIDILYADEAQTISQESLDIVIPTVIRRDGAKIIFAMNPKVATDPVYAFGENPPADTFVTHITYLDNEHLPEAMLRDIEMMKKTNYQKYLNIYMGRLASTTEQQIFTNVVCDRREVFQGQKMYVGLDYGWDHPIACVGCYYYPSERMIYVAHEFVGRKVDRMKLADLLIRNIPGILRTEVVADINEHGTTNMLKKKGFKISPIKKTRESPTDKFVISGVHFLQEHKIVVSPDCPAALAELTNYMWDMDKKTETVLYDKLAPKQRDDCIAAMRYGLNQLRVQKRHLSAMAGSFGNARLYK